MSLSKRADAAPGRSQNYGLKVARDSEASLVIPIGAELAATLTRAAGERCCCSDVFSAMRGVGHGIFSSRSRRRVRAAPVHRHAQASRRMRTACGSTPRCTRRSFRRRRAVAPMGEAFLNTSRSPGDKPRLSMLLASDRCRSRRLSGLRRATLTTASVVTKNARGCRKALLATCGARAHGDRRSTGCAPLGSLSHTDCACCE